MHMGRWPSNFVCFQAQLNPEIMATNAKINPSLKPKRILSKISHALIISPPEMTRFYDTIYGNEIVDRKIGPQTSLYIC